MFTYAGDYEVGLLPQGIALSSSNSQSPTGTNTQRSQRAAAAWFLHYIPRAWYRHSYQAEKPISYRHPTITGEEGAILATSALEPPHNDRPRGTPSTNGTADNVPPQTQANAFGGIEEGPAITESFRWHKLILWATPAIDSSNIEARERTRIWVLYYVTSLMYLDFMLVVLLLSRLTLQNADIFLNPTSFIHLSLKDRVEKSAPSLPTLVLLGIMVTHELFRQLRPSTSTLKIRGCQVSIEPRWVQIRNFILFTILFYLFLLKPVIGICDFCLLILLFTSQYEARKLEEIAYSQLSVQYIRFDE